MAEIGAVGAAYFQTPVAGGLKFNSPLARSRSFSASGEV